MPKSGKAGGAGGGAASQPPTAANVTAPFGQRFDDAFKSLDLNNRNFIALEDMRNKMPDLSREQFDAGLRQLRVERKFTLETHEGLSGTLSEGRANAAIREAGARYVYVSRIR